MRKVIAMLIAPLMPAVLLLVVPVVLNGSWPFNESDYKLIVFFSTVTSYLSLILIGLPIFYWLKKINRLSITSLSFTGSVAGVIVFYIFGKGLGMALNSTASFNLLGAIYGALLGLSVALVFSLIWGKTNAPS